MKKKPTTIEEQREARRLRLERKQQKRFWKSKWFWMIIAVFLILLGVNYLYHIEVFPIYPPAQRELNRRGVPFDRRAARQITEEDLQHFDHIYYMDRSNARYLRSMFGSKADKCRPLLSRDVADPWYTGDFSQTWEDILDGCQRILEELR